MILHTFSLGKLAPATTFDNNDETSKGGQARQTGPTFLVKPKDHSDAKLTFNCGEQSCDETSVLQRLSSHSYKPSTKRISVDSCCLLQEQRVVSNEALWCLCAACNIFIIPIKRTGCDKSNMWKHHEFTGIMKQHCVILMTDQQDKNTCIFTRNSRH